MEDSHLSTTEISPLPKAQVDPSEKIVELDPLFLGPDFDGTFTDTTIVLDEDCRDCD